MKKILLLLLAPLFLCGPLEAKTLRPLVWVIDAGHGGHDSGTRLKDVEEKDITLNIALELEKLLKKNKPGIKVILTRKDDRYVSLEDRCKRANANAADLFLSIHANYAPNKPLLRGTETFFANLSPIGSKDSWFNRANTTDKSELLAWLIQKSYFETGRVSDRGAKRERFFVLLNTNMPAVLTEVGFLSNTEDAQYIKSQRGQQEIAMNLYNALNEYYTTTQAKTHQKTLSTLRQSMGKRSGLNVAKLSMGTQKTPVEDLQKGEEKKASTLQEETKENKVGDQELAANPASAKQQEEDKSAQADPEKKDANKAEEESAGQAGIPVYSIQIVAVSSELKNDDERLKGLFPITFVKSGNMFKGLYGGTTDYKQAQKTLAEIREKFPDAFIVAYIGENPISTAEAIKITNAE